MKFRLYVPGPTCAALIAVPAFADVIPPEVERCKDLSVGDACPGGRCQASTCTRLDYANWDREAGASPPSVSYACVVCKTGGEGGADEASESEPGSCSCSVVGRTLQGVAPWLLASVFWLPLLWRKFQRTKVRGPRA